MTEKEKCIICGEENKVMLHDDYNQPYCPKHFTEYVGYCAICQTSVNIARNYKNEKGEIYCKECMQKGVNFAEKMHSIVEVEQQLEEYNIKIPFDREMLNLSYENLKELKFALVKILSIAKKISK